MFVPQLGIVTALAACAACTDVANAPATDPATTLNETVFRCAAEPVLITQCSFNACHGKADSALRVYSLGKLRTPPATDSITASAPLTEAEQHANFLSAAGFATFGVAAADNWLLKKPLPATDGGFEHAGGAIYTGPGDPNYVAIFKWLNGATTCN
ncbi:MAG: hypothetical protein ABI467_10765 [Kofleriaceae bacterium]